MQEFSREGDLYTHSLIHSWHGVFYAMFMSYVPCRAEFDASSNSIEVRLHLAPYYHCQNGALHPTAPGEDSIITVTFDRRKTVGDLRLAIYQVTTTDPVTRPHSIAVFLFRDFSVTKRSEFNHFQC